MTSLPVYIDQIHKLTNANIYSTQSREHVTKKVE
jgi:hypothetical protein